MIRLPTRRKVLAGCAALLTAAAGLTGCDDDDPPPTGVVRIAVTDPGPLLPGDTTGRAGRLVLSALFTPLVEYDPAGRPRPRAAAAVEPDQRRQVWTIRLRRGFTFHNGEPVTADNYRTAWNHAAYRPHRRSDHHYFRRIAGYRQVNPPDGREPTARRLRGLTVLDRYTLRVTLTEPFAEFPALLGAPAFYPLPAAAFDDTGRLRPGFADHPVGNGPFRIVERRPDRGRLTLTRHHDHPGEPPPLTGIEFVTRSPDEQYPALRAGEVDVATALTPAGLETAAQSGDRLWHHPSATIQFLAFPHERGALADPRVRRAVSMAIDRAALVERFFHGTRTPARSFVPPVIPGARPDTCGLACRFRPAEARRLYTEAGGPARLTVTSNADGGHARWVGAVCRQLTDTLRIRCEAERVPDFPALAALAVDRSATGLLRMGWAMDYPSMASYLGPMFTTTGSANLYGYRRPEVDALVADGTTTADRAGAVAAYRRAEELVAQDLPVIPLWFGGHVLAHTGQMDGLAVTGFDQLDLTRLRYRQ